MWALRGQRLLRGLSLKRKGWDVGKVSKWKDLLRPVREYAGITENCGIMGRCDHGYCRENSDAWRTEQIIE